MSQTARDESPIGRADLKAKLTEIQGEAQEQVEGVRNQILATGIIIAVVLLVITFVLGRRAGKRASAVIEVRRA
ncbi:MAG: hypothetical protein ACKO5A_09955 [Actinomycetota bacterium]|nr:hypothetical protein [Actinomycetota bacterium]